MDSTELGKENDPSSLGSEKGARARRKSRARSRVGEPLPHRWFDVATAALLCFAVIFPPWAFGTTQAWSIGVMNCVCYALGGLMVGKWFVRWVTGWNPGKKLEAVQADRGGLANRTRWPIQLLAGLTVLMLGFCLTSAVNARATYLPSDRRFDYHECVMWLPHSYDSTSTWGAFQRYLALAALFWAARDWIQGGVRVGGAGARECARDLADWQRGVFMPGRLRRLLWLVSINGAALALEGILQRSLGTNRLLWLIEPFYTKEPDLQFGPYAYRSNAAQYLGLVWPVALGFWWILRHGSSHRQRAAATANLLLPCTLLMIVAALISLSRAGAGITCGAGAVAGAILLRARRRRNWMAGFGLTALLGIILLSAWYIGWNGLSERFKTTEADFDSTRYLAWRTSLPMVKDFPVFGTGPGTFMVMYGIYRSSPLQEWEAYLHNDWLETVITFGWVGFCGIFLMALLGSLGSLLGSGTIPAHRVLIRFLWLSLAACLVYAIVDFPFQIYSVLSLFLLVCSTLTCLSRNR